MRIFSSDPRLVERRRRDAAYRLEHPEKVQEANRERYLSHRAERLARSRAWYEANTEMVKARESARYWANRDAQVAQRRAYYATHKREMRVAQVLHDFGLTPDAIEKMLKDQWYSCAVCEVAFDDSVRRGTFFVDHNHATGAVRGLLCNTCNRGLGLFRDNPRVLVAAASYLQEGI